MIGSLNPAVIFHRMVQGSVRCYMVKSKPHGPSTNRTMTQTPYTVTVTIMPENEKSENWKSETTKTKKQDCQIAEMEQEIKV